MNKTTHDILRLLQWLIPALSALYVAVDQYLGFGNSEAVCGIAAAITTFIGVCAEHSSNQYFADKTINKVVSDEAVGSDEVE